MQPIRSEQITLPNGDVVTLRLTLRATKQIEQELQLSSAAQVLAAGHFGTMGLITCLLAMSGAGGNPIDEETLLDLDFTEEFLADILDCMSKLVEKIKRPPKKKRIPAKRRATKRQTAKRKTTRRRRGVSGTKSRSGG